MANEFKSVSASNRAKRELRFHTPQRPRPGHGSGSASVDIHVWLMALATAFLLRDALPAFPLLNHWPLEITGKALASDPHQVPAEGQFDFCKLRSDEPRRELSSLGPQ